MITAYDLYKQAHESLFTCATQQELHQASKETVKNYLENRLIWEELSYYKEHGTILGKHPIFSRLRRVDQIRGMKVSELVNLKIRLDNNLIRNRAAVRRQPKHPLTGERNARIIEMEAEMVEVNRLLNL